MIFEGRQTFFLSLLELASFAGFDIWQTYVHTLEESHDDVFATTSVFALHRIFPCYFQLAQETQLMWTYHISSDNAEEAIALIPWWGIQTVAQQQQNAVRVQREARGYRLLSPPFRRVYAKRQQWQQELPKSLFLKWKINTIPHEQQQVTGLCMAGNEIPRKVWQTNQNSGLAKQTKRCKTFNYLSSAFVPSTWYTHKSTSDRRSSTRRASIWFTILTEVRA